MKNDKLNLRLEIQNDFVNESVRNIDLAIKISKIMRFLYSETTIFLISMIPTIVVSIYYLKTSPIDTASATSIVLMSLHFVLYKTLYMKFLFKDSKSEVENYDYTIKVLNEIRSTK